MELFDKIVHPQSAEQMELLRNLLLLSYIILLPYLSALTGSIMLSVYFNKAGSRSGNSYYLKFAKGLADLVTFNKSLTFGLGLVPLLSIIFSYAQLLRGSDARVTSFLFIAFLFLLTAFILVYAYKYSFHLKDVLSSAGEKVSADEKSTKEEIESYKNKAAGIFNIAGTWGVILILAAGFILIGSIQLAADSSSWDKVTNIFWLIFSFSTILNFLTFVAASLVTAVVTLIYLYFRGNSELNLDDDYKEFIRDKALKTGLISSIALIFFTGISVLTYDATALSQTFFIVLIAALILFLIITNLFYSMLRNSNIEYSNALVFLLVIFFALSLYKENEAFATTANHHFEKLALDYSDYKAEAQKAIGAFKEVISGEDIFNGRCIACHKFDQKLVGPPYNETLPKYEGKIEDLANYILNPVKVNPDYPVMPNQGLKPKEAKAVAEYIMNTWKGK